MKKIKDFLANDSFHGLLLVKHVTTGTTNKSSPYVSLILQDDSGEIEAKIWDVRPSQLDVCIVGTIVEIEADIIKYQDKNQLKIRTIKAIDQSNLELEQFAPHSKKDKETMGKELNGFIQQIKDPILKKVVITYLEKVGSDFLIYPAAQKNHHEYLGGLASHTLEMLNLAKNICDLYAFLNRDLIYSGILVHDIAKIEEYTNPILVEYSKEGRLLGHISLAQAAIYQIAHELKLEGYEQILLLRHIVLSHHGKLEFGSPVLPMIAEAEVINLIDNISARMNMFEKYLNVLEAGSFSGKVFSLENRNIYKPSL